MSMTRIVAASLRLETPSSPAGPLAGPKQSAKARALFRRRAIRYGLLGFNILLLSVVGFFVLQSSDSGGSAGASSLGSLAARGNDNIVDPLDRLSSADIAVNVARVANLPQKVAITNQADSENAQLAVSQTSDSLVSKPQVISSVYKSNKDIQIYEAKSGDTAASIAAQFHVTTDTILWSNDLANNNVTPGTKIYLLPGVNGIIYVVKAGDTPESLAEKYKSSKEKIVAYNDAEINGLQVGTRIIIPDGQIVKAAAIATGSYASGFPWGGGPLYSGNGYVYGYCTWYVANVIAVPSNWGNANTWDNLAPRSGWVVSSVPRVGAIGQTDRGAEGHVAVVEAVSEDGTMIKYSDMNGLAGYARVGRTADWVSAAKYEHYIYR